MLLFNVEFECDNDAFYPNPNFEVARILRELASRVEESDYSQDVIVNYKISDLNGNKIGSAVFFSEP